VNKAACESVTVAGNGTLSLKITWFPTAAGNMREMVTLTDGKNRFMFKMVGVAHVPTPKKVYRAKAAPKTTRNAFKVKKAGQAKAKAEPSNLSRVSGVRSAVKSPAGPKQFLKRKSAVLKLTKRKPVGVMPLSLSLARADNTTVEAAAAAISAAKSAAAASATQKRLSPNAVWADKQERCFTRWLNFVLCPTSVEGGGAAAGSMADVRTRLQVRAAAAAIVRSTAFAATAAKIDAEVDAGRIAIREDRNPQADVGLRGEIVALLMAYSPGWLLVGLEAVYGETVTAADGRSLTLFLEQRLLLSAEVAAEFAHPTVPGHFGAGFAPANKRMLVKRFLRLVLLLDQAKVAEIREGRPCLFQPHSELKESKDLLFGFARLALKGEGDVTKHLKMLGYVVGHQQSPLDEFGFRVTNLATDLTDGIRLARAVENLTGKSTLGSSLRVPATERLLKQRNVKLALSLLNASGCATKVDPKHVAMGNRIQTMIVLWQMVMHFKVDVMLDPAALSAEIAALKGRHAYRTSVLAATTRRHSGARLVTTWLRADDASPPSPLVFHAPLAERHIPTLPCSCSKFCRRWCPLPLNAA
jgi:abnormal spindle-like microcephaly-associated protein